MVMYITINTGNELVKVGYEAAMNSKLIMVLIQTYGNEYIIQFSDKYQEAVEDYITWLNDEPVLLFCTRKQIKYCLEFEAYIDNSKFFEFSH